MTPIESISWMFKRDAVALAKLNTDIERFKWQKLDQLVEQQILIKSLKYTTVILPK
jgi:hypothetical protein